MAESPLTGEVSNSKVAAVFVDVASATHVAERVRHVLQLGDAQVQAITPFDHHPGPKLEPEDRGIFRTLVRAHAKLAAVGVVAGLLVFALMWSRGVPWIINSAVLAAGVLASFGPLAGLLLGGLMTHAPRSRPVHPQGPRGTRRRPQRGGRACLHPTAEAHAEALLHEASGEVVATL